MPIGTTEIIAGLIQAGNKLLDHTLKPAAEKMKDLRFKYLKRMWKWRKSADIDHREDEKRLDDIKKKLS